MKLMVMLFFLNPLPPAQAYIDPGSGALIWQMLLAGVVGGLFYIKQVYLWFCSFFQKKETKKPND